MQNLNGFDKNIKIFSYGTVESSNFSSAFSIPMFTTQRNHWTAHSKHKLKDLYVQIMRKAALFFAYVCVCSVPNEEKLTI